MHNRTLFFRRVAALVRLSRFQRATVAFAASGLRYIAPSLLRLTQRTQDCEWLGSGGGTQAHAARTRRLRQLSAVRSMQIRLTWQWIFDVLVIPTIRAHFFVTETAASRNRPFFFRKPVCAAQNARTIAKRQVWRLLQSIAVASLASGMLQRLPDDAAREVAPVSLILFYFGGV